VETQKGKKGERKRRARRRKGGREKRGGGGGDTSLIAQSMRKKKPMLCVGRGGEKMAGCPIPFLDQKERRKTLGGNHYREPEGEGEGEMKHYHAPFPHFPPGGKDHERVWDNKAGGGKMILVSSTFRRNWGGGEGGRKGNDPRGKGRKFDGVSSPIYFWRTFRGERGETGGKLLLTRRERRGKGNDSPYYLLFPVVRNWAERKKNQTRPFSLAYSARRRKGGNPLRTFPIDVSSRPGL